MSKNKIKSIRDRLLNISRKEKIDFNQILLFYFHVKQKQLLRVLIMRESELI
ncbi:hypothetical protein [Selenihalanaerobacter shriftii]|uniref:hypothetical protein n=1 Tax=Selenihalanaerobacter shriftii TaxID=142842 RepID=UPI0013565820|nr:hypothetical protein [Selenihalanaerobacter shriftii]